MTGKRTAPNLSEESDDAVVEPLLPDTLDNTIISAKYFAKEKADTLKEINKRFNDKKLQSASTSGFCTNETSLSEKDQAVSKSSQNSSISNAPLHNHMNTNVFHSHESSKASNTTKSQLLVEIDGCKQSRDNPNPLIFTTAKIHTDGKSKHMEPVQMTPAPVLSTVEVSVTKGSHIPTTNEKIVSNGTSIMNTLHSLPSVNEKEKDNTVKTSNSNVPPLTQMNDDISIAKTTDPNKTTTKANSPLDIKGSTAKSSNSKVTSSVVQKKAMNDKANPNKPSIQSTPSNNASEIRSLPETSRAMPVNVKDNPVLTKDTKDDKKLVDEPRIVSSESKLKLSVSDKANTNTSLNTATSSGKSTKVSEPSSKKPQINQPSEKLKSVKDLQDKNSNVDRDSNINRMGLIDLNRIQNKNIKLPDAPKDFASKINLNDTKPLNPKNIPPEMNAITLKIETKTIPKSSKNTQRSPEPSAKAFSSSTKTTTQSNVLDSKEMNKSPKPSANEIKKVDAKMSLNNTDTSSANKSPTPVSIVKSVNNVSSSNVPSSATTKSSNETVSSNLKGITSTVPTCAPLTMSSSAIKTQSASTKTATSTGNTKGTSVTSTKSSTKTSLPSSTRSPNSSIPTTKQPGTSTAKTTSGKPPPLAFTKTPQVNISSPNATTPASKPTVSKAQVSSSNPAGHKGRPATASSTIASDTSNKTKASESNKKGGSKLSDQTKDTKVSKG